MISRRRFLELSAFTGAALLLPKMLQGFTPVSAVSLKKLIVLELSGGNDGLSMLVPFRNDIYHRSRPHLALKKADLLPLFDEAGLHPALRFCRSVYDDGELCFLNSVGYPDASRSHQQSLDYWHTAGGGAAHGGWLGTYLDRQNGSSLVAIVEDHGNGAVVGRYREAPSIAAFKPTNGYPDTGLGARFSTIAQLVQSGSPTQVYYLTLGGFDTHVDQARRQGVLLQQIDEALAAFVSKMKASGHWQDVLVIAFSEFGRSIHENEFKGTDHGGANTMLVLGGGIKTPGLYNPLPSLTHLEDGGLLNEIDFREVYATVLERWLLVDAAEALGKQYAKLNFI